jgi:hypothetical protein
VAVAAGVAAVEGIARRAEAEAGDHRGGQAADGDVGVFSVDDALAVAGHVGVEVAGPDDVAVGLAAPGAGSGEQEEAAGCGQGLGEDAVVERLVALVHRALGGCHRRSPRPSGCGSRADDDVFDVIELEPLDAHGGVAAHEGLPPGIGFGVGEVDGAAPVVDDRAGGVGVVAAGEGFGVQVGGGGSWSSPT